MSGKDHPETAGRRVRSGDGGDGGPADPSRRAVLRGAAGAGVAGVAASSLIGLPAQALASTARPAARSAAGRKAAAGEEAGGAESARDVVVHVRDARSGEMDIFAGTSLTRLHDPELASRLVRAIR